MFATMFVGGLTLLASCKDNSMKPVSCTMEAPLSLDSAPDLVNKAMETPIIDDRFENILNDEANGISVWSLMKLSEEQSSEGFGIVVKNGKTISSFPNIRHGRMPSANYDAEKKYLWLTGADIEGTGTQVERLYLLRFNEDGKATIVTSLDPFDVQNKMCDSLTYRIDDEQIMLSANGNSMTVKKSPTTDLGNFDENAVRIGEQLTYDLSGAEPVLQLTPGVKFTASEMLDYEEMPSITATISVSGDSLSLSNFRIVAE